jgi:KaiC/GvpD/RAD55 family RecA-like ATPase
MEKKIEAKKVPGKKMLIKDISKNNRQSVQKKTLSLGSKSRTGNKILSDEQLQQLLQPGREFESKMEGVMKELADGTANLVIVSVEEYGLVAKTILHHFQSSQIPGVYVTTNKPYYDLLKGMENVPSNIHFVDVITSLAGREKEETPNVTFLDSPLELVEMDVSIQGQLSKITGSKKFLCLDSISTLLVYNSPEAVERFSHTVVSKNRKEEVIILLIMVESEENENVINTLGQFVDQTIRMY